MTCSGDVNSGLICPDLFLHEFAVSCLIINMAGFVLLHRGIGRVLTTTERRDVRYTRRALLRDIAISLCYTALMVFLVKTGIIRPVQDYMK